MAVSGAGSGAAPAEGAGEGQQQGGEAAQQQAGLPEAFENRFSEFEQRFGAVPDQLSQLMQAFSDAGDEGEAGALQQEANSPFILGADGQIYDLRSGQPVDAAELGGEDQGLTQEQLDARIEERARAIAQEAVNPLVAEQRAQQLAALEDSYPEMRDPKVAGSVVEEARQLAAEMGAPDAWRNPQVLENTYLAMKARENAGQEVPATGRVQTELEQPGASGAQAQSPEDEANEIVAAGTSGAFFG